MRYARNTSLALLAALAFTAGAHQGAMHPASDSVRAEQKDWGIAGEAKAATRTISVTMGDDMRFTPELIEVKQGETVRIVVANRGRMLHEFVLGTIKELDEHAALMMKFPNMAHDEPYMVHVPPGQSGQMIWTFNRAGQFDFACLIAGHYQAGMVGKIKVAQSADTPAAKPQASVADEYTRGEIRKIDRETGKVTLKHEEIRNLGMPPMAMVFETRDPKMLDRFKAGDKVRFRASYEGGKYVLRDIEPVQ